MRFGHLVVQMRRCCLLVRTTDRMLMYSSKPAENARCFEMSLSVLDDHSLQTGHFCKVRSCWYLTAPIRVARRVNRCSLVAKQHLAVQVVYVGVREPDLIGKHHDALDPAPVVRVPGQAQVLPVVPARAGGHTFITPHRRAFLGRHSRTGTSRRRAG